MSTRMLKIKGVEPDEQEEARIVHRQRPFEGPDDPRRADFEPRFVALLSDYGPGNMAGALAFVLSETARAAIEEAREDPSQEKVLGAAAAMKVVRVAGDLAALIRGTYPGMDVGLKEPR